MSDGRILCVIPARGGSKRIPRKNVVDLCGKPLIAYTIEAARDAGIFERIVVSTEDAEIGDLSRKYGATVLERGAELAGDKASVMDVCLNVLEHYENEGDSFDFVCVLLPTSPLRTSSDISGAFDKLKGTDSNAVMAVTTFEIPPFWALKEEDGFVQPFFGDKYMVRSQDLPKVFVDNGAIYIFRTPALKEERKFYCSRLMPYKMSRENSLDVDEMADLKLAEFFIRQRGEKQ